MLRRAVSSSISRLVNLSVASSRHSCHGTQLLAPAITAANIYFFCLFYLLSSQMKFVPSTYRLYSTEIDLSNDESRRRLTNRLLYRSKQRGFLELDLVLGKWVEENINSMDENGIRSLIQVLDLENPDLWNWLTGKEQPPESVSSNPVFTAIHEKITSTLDSHSAPETRANPGQTWVRGWDDIKRGPGSPIAGNQ